MTRFLTSLYRSPIILALVVAHVGAGEAEAATIYWGDGTGVHRTSNDGKTVETVVSDPEAYIFSMALDEENGWLYWSDNRSRTIHRSYLDGSHAQTIYQRQGEWPYALYVDNKFANKIYWSEFRRIMSSDLDGSNVITLLSVDVTPPFMGMDLFPAGVVPDPPNGHLYIPAAPGFAPDSFIFRTDLDGSNLEEVFHFEPDPWVSEVVLDRSGEKLFALRNGNDTYLGASVWRMNRDGANAENVLEVGIGEIVWDLVEGDQSFYLSMGSNLNSADPSYGIYTTDAAFGSPILLFDLENAAASMAIDFSLPGDANGDGLVNLEDFNSLKSNFGAGSKRSQGDFNADHLVDLIDFNILKTNFGSGGAAVPEPSAWCLAGAAFSGALLARRRRVRRP